MERVISMKFKNFNKIIVLVMVLLTSICITGCKSKDAKETEKIIESIGEVNLQSKDVIQEAFSKYDALSDKQKKEVENYSVLLDAQNSYNILVAGDFSEKINQLPTIPSKIDVATLKNEYEKLDDSQKELVEGYDKLIELELLDLEKMASVQSSIDESAKEDDFTKLIVIYEEYNKLTKDEKNYITGIDELEKKIAITDNDKVGIAAAKFVRSILKSPDSLNIKSIEFRKLDGIYYVYVSYSATNSYGAVVSDSLTVDVGQTYSIGMIELSTVLGGMEDVSLTNLSYFYKANNNTEVVLNPDKIMYYIDEEIK